MHKVGFLAAVILLAAAVPRHDAEARMYQWVDPVTGSVQMSGKPPAWYRSGWDGPRVRVLENGLLIDDTAIDVSDDEKQALREEAFRQFAEGQELEALKRLERDKLKEDERDRRLSEVDEAALVEAEEEASDELLPNTISEETIEKLKNLVEQWDTLSPP